MISSIIKKFESIYLIGCLPTLQFEESKRIVLTNQICLIFSIFTAPYSYLFHYIGASALAIGILVIMTNYIICFYLNKYHYFLLSKILLISTILIPAYIYSSVLGPDSGIQFVNLVLACSSFVIFQAKHKIFRVIFVILPILSYTLLEFREYSFFYEVTALPTHLFMMRYVVIVNIFVIFLLLQYFYMNISQHFEQTLDTILKLHGITKRESEVIHYLMAAKNNKEIAKCLFIEESTVKTHVKNIFIKLEINSRVELVSMLNEKSSVK